MKDDNFGLDPQEVKKQEEAKRKFERERKLKISDLRRILATPEGRRTIWNELCRTKLFADFFSLNSLEMARFCGERSIGIKLLDDIMEARPESFYQMYTEEMSKKKSEEKQEELKQGEAKQEEESKE